MPRVINPLKKTKGETFQQRYERLCGEVKTYKAETQKIQIQNPTSDSPPGGSAS